MVIKELTHFVAGNRNFSKLILHPQQIKAWFYDISR